MNLLEEFVYLAESLNFRRTADHFYVSRSVISRHMNALEEAVEARLIDRDSRTVELTDAGRVFYRDAKVVLRDWESALERVRDSQLGGGIVVRVGYLRNAARPVLVRFVRYMAQAHPDVRISLSCLEYADLRRAMEEHAVDVALAMNVNPAISRNYRSTRIYEDDFFVVCAADHPLAKGKRSLSLKDLRQHKVLVPDNLKDVGLHDLSGMLADDGVSDGQSPYRDTDMLNLKMQTERCLVLSSGLNSEQFGSEAVMLPIADADTSFAVSAFYQDDFTGDPYLACQDGFEHCRHALEGR